MGMMGIKVLLMGMAATLGVVVVGIRIGPAESCVILAFSMSPSSVLLEHGKPDHISPSKSSHVGLFWFFVLTPIFSLISC